MDKTVRAKLQQLIENQLVKLKQQIHQLEEASALVNPDNAIGRLSRLEAMRAQSIAKDNLNQVKADYKQLEDSLEHLDDDNFGICSECNEAIPLARIVLMPSTHLCAQCAHEC